MAEGELVDVSWQLPEEGRGTVVAHRADGSGELTEHRFPVGPDGELDGLPDDVARIVEDDGRDYGVWTRR